MRTASIVPTESVENLASMASKSKNAHGNTGSIPRSAVSLLQNRAETTSVNASHEQWSRYVAQQSI